MRVQREEPEVHHEQCDHAAKEDEREDEALRGVLSVYAGDGARDRAHQHSGHKGGDTEDDEVVEPHVGLAPRDGRVNPDRGHSAYRGRNRSEQAHGERHHRQRRAHDPREGLDREPLASECDEDQQSDERGGMPFIGACHPHARGGHAQQEQGLQSPQLALAEFPCAHCRLCCP